MKKKLISLILFALTIFCLAASPVSAMEYFTTTSYDIDMTVTEDHAYHVTETINVNFSEPRHGLYRYIPYKGHFYRDVNGEPISSHYTARLYDIDVPDFNYETYSEEGSRVIQIGDENTYVDGPVTYTISYIWNPGEDKIDAFDDVYYNLIPHNWKTAIDNASFTIHMPKSFDPASLEFISGDYGSIANNHVQYTVDGNTIHGRIMTPLAAGEGVTINLRLPEGYYTAIPNNNLWFILMISAFLICMVIAAILWFKFGRDHKPLEPVTFYPPMNMTPAQIGTIIDGKTGQEEILSMIIWLADQGHLRIEQTDKKHFKFIKQQPLPQDAPNFAKTVFKGLFPGGRKSSTSENLDNFHEDMIDAQAQVRAFFDEPEHALFTDRSNQIRTIVYAIAFIPAIIFGILFGYLYEGYFSILSILISIVFVGICPIIFMIIFFNTLSQRQGLTKGKVISRIFVSLLLTLIALNFTIFFSDSEEIMPSIYILIYYFITACILFFATFSHKRTDQGNKWLGETLGFKHFIKTAELDRIKTLVDENPSYFYNILPYAYVLGVTDKWAKRFETLAIEPPHWYHTYDDYRYFNSVYFTHSLMHSMNNMSSTITISPDSGSGGFGDSGFSDGGGFSGGGGGGGGGGSW